jgi:hypothetical protein
MAAVVLLYCFSVSIHTLISFCKQVSTLEFIRKTDVGLMWQGLTILVVFNSGLSTTQHGYKVFKCLYKWTVRENEETFCSAHSD